MAQIVIMPKEGITVESCLIGAWRKSIGEAVAANDVLFEYETDKAAFECVSAGAGVLLYKFYEQGDEAPVLAPVAIVGEAGEDISSLIEEGWDAGDTAEAAAPEIPQEEKDRAAGDSEGAGIADRDGAEAGGTIASPRARSLAEEQGVDLGDVVPTGPDRRILEADVIAAANVKYTAPETADNKGQPEPDAEKAESMPERAQMPERIAPEPDAEVAGSMPERAQMPERVAPEPDAEKAESMPERAQMPETPLPEATPQGQAPEPEPDTEKTDIRAAASGGAAYEDVAFSKIRSVIGRTMTASLQRSAQLTHHHSFDATNILAMREDFKASDEALGYRNVSVGDIILYVASRVLAEHPEINALVADTGVRRCYTVNLGIAVDTPRGLMVPTVFGAEKKSLLEISTEVRALAEAAREGRISPDRLKGGTFTVSNLGATGVEMFTPIINPPQAAIAGICGVIERVRKGRDGRPVIYPSIGVSLTYDHRAVDGAPASRFAAELCDALAGFSWKMLAFDLERKDAPDRV